MSLLRRRCPLGFHAHCDEVASSVLCPWGGGVFDLPEAGFAARAIAGCSASFGSPGQPVESFCFGDANGGPAFRGPDVRPPGLLLALHGHIETFSKVPKRLYRLFNAPVSLGPSSSECRRAAAFVTRMGNFWFKFGQTLV
ncbi:hypothetical protein CDL15_Pgr014152 [Punica granatum]|uniref:Uncharacterized protein n=1 Tax=Punica granatum TaxID=22663 RepID=A0A218XJR9_PUNGR|nr:hypothetical protein CDL15_Pgr014152 [Punica granatum]